MGVLSFITTLIAHTLLFTPCLKVTSASDSISQSQKLSDGPDGTTLVSSGGTFELGFFSPGSSNKRYLGIWFKNIPVQTVVWVANRANPINDSNGILTLTNGGNLVLTHNNKPVWDIASSLKKPYQQKNPLVAQLLDSGNLVVREENDPNSKSYLWQSFDYPTNTELAGMKLGYDRRVGLNRRITAWKSPDDPAPGEFSLGVAMHEYPDICTANGTQILSRWGPWDGLRFSGNLALKPNPIYDYSFVFNKDEAYFSWTLRNSSVISIAVLKQSTRYRYVWSIGTSENWEVYNQLPADQCDNFGRCGVNAYCAITESPICQCLKGFKPKSPQRWDAMDWTQGCVRIKPLNCTDKYSTDGFVKLDGLKVPDTTRTWVDVTMSLDECREKCLSNCSCMAFTNSDIRDAGNGCVMWFDDLLDIRQVGGADEQDLFVRMDASQIDTAHKRRKKLTVIVAAIVPTISTILLLGFYQIYRIQRNMIEKQNIQNNEQSDDDLDLPLLNLSTIATATDKFSEKNKIGEGGFGPVYKGRLVNGQEIAVKRLSRSSGQGFTEFKNEVKLIAKLQHRNLAWELWNQSKAKELIDPKIEDSCIVSEALRCIHVSLLCVQQYPEDRPTMPSIVLMLESETELPKPKEPGFFPRKVFVETSPGSNQEQGGPTNEITITLPGGR